MGVSPDATVMLEKRDRSLIPTRWVNSVNEFALIVVTDHQLKHWVAPLV